MGFTFSVSLGYWSSGSFLPDLKTRVWVWAWVSWALSFVARCWQCQGRNVGWTRAVGPLLHYTIWPLRTGIRFSFNWNSCRRSLTIALAVTSSFHCPDNPCLFLCRCCLAPGAAVSLWTPHQRCGHCPNSNQHGNFRKLPADYGFCVPALSMPASWGLFCLRLFVCVCFCGVFWYWNRLWFIGRLCGCEWTYGAHTQLTSLDKRAHIHGVFARINNRES